MPALVYLLASRVFDIEPLWMMVAVMMAAQPTGVMTYIFAEKYKVGQAIATTSIFLSTSLSMVTLSVILFPVRCALRAGPVKSGGLPASVRGDNVAPMTQTFANRISGRISNPAPCGDRANCFDQFHSACEGKQP